MQKIYRKPMRRDPEIAIRVRRTANICGVSTRAVYNVINGDWNNERILSVYLSLYEGENKLIKAVKEAVPFN
jgi:hypothetical protein